MPPCSEVALMRGQTSLFVVFACVMLLSVLALKNSLDAHYSLVVELEVEYQQLNLLARNFDYLCKGTGAGRVGKVGVDRAVDSFVVTYPDYLFTVDSSVAGSTGVQRLTIMNKYSRANMTFVVC